MAHIVEHALRALRAHACKWQDLPEVTVESAAVDDEQTAEWSRAEYEKDLARDRKDRGLALLVVFGALLVAGIIGAGVAKADSTVCPALAASPTVGTVEQLVINYMANGVSGRDAGAIIAANVIGDCPQYLPVLRRFVAAYAPDQPVSARVGGRAR